MAVDRQIKRTPNPQERKQMVVENAENIQKNHKLIKQNRLIIGTMSVFLALAVTVIVYLVANQHDMEACQTKLYEHLTNQKAPTKKELHRFEKIENPKVYKDLFEGCQ